MNLNEYPPCYHRNAEYAGDEFEAICNLIQVSIDSLQLANVLGLEHVTEVLKMTSERAFNAVKPMRELQGQLFLKWSAEVEAQKDTGVSR